MSINWVIFIVAIWVFGAILGATMSGGDPFAAGPNVTALTTPGFNMAWFGSIWDVMSLDFSFFEGKLQILRWICLLPIVAGLSYGITILILNYIRGK